MQRSTRISSSVLAADFARLGEEVKLVSAAGADYIHLDVMDGHFVPNLTFGPDVVKALRPYSSLPFDVHLMIAPVDPYIKDFTDAGADIITVHPESGGHFDRTLRQIHQAGKKAGIAINPDTPVEILDDVVDLVDLILVMTVNPGFGGQTFIESQLTKIARARALIDATEKTIDLSVDGGINPRTAELAVAAGADVLVAGTSVFRGVGASYIENIERLRHA